MTRARLWVQPAAYAMAVLLPLATLLTRANLPIDFSERPLLVLFMLPIIVSAMAGGLGPGLLATLITALLTHFFLTPPLHDHDYMQWAVLIVNGVLVAAMAELLHRARRRAVTHSQELDAAQEQLRNSEARFHATFELAAVGIALVAPDGRWLRVNRHLSNLLGYSPEELLTRTFQDITHPDDLAADLDQVRRMLTREIDSYTLEKRYLRRDGTTVWAKLAVTLTWKTDGTPDFFISVIADIDARKQAEAAWRQAQNQLMAFIRNAPVSIAMFDREMNYLVTSGRWLAEFGCGRTDLSGLNHYALYPDLPARYKIAHQRGLAGETIQTQEDLWLRENGSRRWLRWAVQPWTDENNRIGGILIAGEDISAHKQAEQDLHQAQDAALAEQHQARLAALNLMEEAMAARQHAEAALADLSASEARFRALVEQSLAGIYIIQDERFRYVNPGFAAMFGYDSAEALIDRVPVGDLVSPEYRDRVAENIRRRVAGDANELQYTFTGLRRDGGRIAVEVHGRAFEYQGRPAVIGLLLDVTARQAAEGALRESETRFHDIVNVSADWIWEVDAEGRYTFVSDSVEHMLGYTPAEILGKTPFDLMPPEEAERLRAQFADLVARRAPFRDLANINLHKDGSRRHVSTNGIAILDKDGTLLGYRGLDRDITEIRLAQLNREETGNRLRTLINTLPDLVWLKDTNGVYLTCNPRFEAFFGALEADIVGKTDHDFVAADLADFFRAHDLAAIDAGGPTVNEEEVTFASDGHRETLHTIKTPIRDSTGQVIGVLGIARDISERKEAVAALQRLTDDLSATLRAIPDLLFEVDEAGRYLRIEATVHSLLAAPAEQLLGHTVSEMLPPEAAQTVMKALASAARHGSDYGRTITLPLAAGPHHFELSVARKSMDAGTGQQFIVLSRDITTRKQAEDELRRSNEELQRFNRATVGRELDMIDLKKQVNALARELGQEPPYSLAFVDDKAERP